jgi:cystathionine gamma-synthase
MTYKDATQAVHAGEPKRKPFGAVTTPIIQTSTYTFSDTAEILDFMRAKEDGGANRDEYGRYSNPTQTVAERKLALLEGGDQALLFSSGMSAITTTMLTLLSQGDHVVLVNGVYKRTREFVQTYLKRWGIQCSVVPIDDAAALDAVVRPNTCLIFAESPTNPYLRVMDLERLATVGQRHSCLTMVDSTFATPINLRPLDLGIDLVIHSASKYLGGHNDLLAGVLIGPATLVEQVEEARGVFGGISNPNDAYLLLRGLKTLELRVCRQNENGLRVARFLADHEAVTAVHYPGLPGHVDHAVAQRLMTGFGGVVSFDLAGDFETTGRFIDRLQLPYIGPTLGGVESIVQQPAALLSLDPQARAEAGIGDTLVRYALGVEDARDIIDDLRQALAV